MVLRLRGRGRVGRRQLRIGSPLRFGTLPAGEQPRSRTVGLTLAMVPRILLLLSLTGIMRLTRPLFSPFGHPFSGRDLILLLGGLFLLWKSTREIHDKREGEEGQQNVKAGATF